MSASWPCSTCGEAGVKNLGTRGYCSLHLSDLLSKFDPVVFQLNGVGLQDGRMRPDYGPHWADLRCCACGATWVGVPGDPCGWCTEALRIITEFQAELVCRRPDVDPAAANYDAAIVAWAERLARAVNAGLIDDATARRVLGRCEVAHAA